MPRHRRVLFAHVGGVPRLPRPSSARPDCRRCDGRPAAPRAGGGGRQRARGRRRLGARPPAAVRETVRGAAAVSGGVRVSEGRRCACRGLPTTWGFRLTLPEATPDERGIAVVIATVGRADALRVCLDSL